MKVNIQMFGGRGSSSRMGTIGGTSGIQYKKVVSYLNPNGNRMVYGEGVSKLQMLTDMKTVSITPGAKGSMQLGVKYKNDRGKTVYLTAKVNKNSDGTFSPANTADSWKRLNANEAKEYLRKRMRAQINNKK